VTVKRSLLLLAVSILVTGIKAGFQIPEDVVAAPIGIGGAAVSGPGGFASTRAWTGDGGRAGFPLDHSCAHPLPDWLRECDELEQQILASTVRLEWHLWTTKDDGHGFSSMGATAERLAHKKARYQVGHAPIKDGRYLVTHNHWPMVQSDTGQALVVTISVYTSGGEAILEDRLLEDIGIASEEAGALVFDFGTAAGEGLFAYLGLPSVQFRAWELLPLRPGMEVAQVNWVDGLAQVEWVAVNQVTTVQGMPTLELGGSAMPGASGGGVFWNGYHIANNRSQVTVLDVDTGAVLSRHSMASLNSPQAMVAGNTAAPVGPTQAHISPDWSPKEPSRMNSSWLCRSDGSVAC
jgi:hypothetical protein